MADRSYALNVLADISKYQSEFAKIPGYTDKQAASAAQKLVAQMNKAQIQAAKDAKKAAEQGASSWSSAFKSLGGSGLGSLTALLANPITGAGAAIAAAGTMMFSLADKSSQFVDKIGNFAAMTGLAKDSVLGLNYAAQAGGLALEDMQTGLGKLLRSMNEAKGGTGAAAEMFADYGIKVTDSAGNLRSMDAVLLDVGAQLRDIEDPTARAAMAADIFGAKGAKLGLVLADGGKSLEEWTAAAKKAGAVGLEASAASNAMDQAMAGLNLQLDAATTKLGTEYTATIATAMDALSGLLSVVNVFIPALSMIGTVAVDIAIPFKGFYDVYKLFSAEVEEATPKTNEMAAALGGMSDAADDAAESLKPLTTFVSMVGDANARFEEIATGATDAQVKQAKELRRAQAAHEAYVETLDLGTEAGKADLVVAQQGLEVIERTIQAEAELASRRERERAAAAAAKKDAQQRVKDAEAQTKAAQKLGEAIAGVAEDVQRSRMGADAFGYRKALEDLSTLKAEAIAAGQDITAIEERENQIRFERRQAWASRQAELQEMERERVKALVAERSAVEKRAADEEADRLADLSMRRDAYYSAAIDSAQNVAATVGTLAQGEVQERTDAISKLQQRLEDGEETLTDSQKANIKARIEEQRKALNKAFRAEQAADISSVLMSAGTAAMAAFSPPPVGAGPLAGGILAATMGGLAAAQIATIAAEKPPKFRGGGMLPDERIFVGEPGEAVLSRAGVASVGGPRGVEAINRGQVSPGGGMLHATFRMGTRAIDEASFEAIGGSGKMRQLTRPLRPRGRHSPWRGGI